MYSTKCVDKIRDLGKAGLPRPYPRLTTHRGRLDLRAALNADHGVRSGQRVGKYILGEQIARGGMAEVWAARVEGPQGFVKSLALKFILETFRGDAELERLFVNEARVAAQLQHANLVGVFDFDKVTDDESGAGPLLHRDGADRRTRSAARASGRASQRASTFAGDRLARRGGGAEGVALRARASGCVGAEGPRASCTGTCRLTTCSWGWGARSSCRILGSPRP